MGYRSGTLVVCSRIVRRDRVTTVHSEVEIWGSETRHEHLPYQ
jgi:hypothetical protein